MNGDCLHNWTPWYIKSDGFYVWEQRHCMKCGEIETTRYRKIA
jgi:hypothetical protein